MLISFAVVSGLEKNENDEKNVTRPTYGITICENGSYCCGNSAFADTCCTLKQGLFVGNSFTPSSSTGVSNSFTSQTLPTSPSTSRSFAPSSSQKATLQIGVVVGGTVGGVGGFAALTLCALIWKRRHRRIQQNHQKEMLQRPVISNPSAPFERRDGENVLQFFELSGNNGRGELDGTDMILELDPSRTWHEMH